PLCDRPVEDKAYKPFCSKRCADVDLSRWLKGSYAIPGRSTDEGDGLPGNDPSSEQ
ncbi:MAG: DNA gyrase inhibitor YacG, partial [Pseudomonadota bacterium]